MFELKQFINLRGTTLDLRRANAKGEPLDTRLPHLFQLTSHRGAGVKEDEHFVCGGDDGAAVLWWAKQIQTVIANLMILDADPMTASIGWRHYLLLGSLHAAALTGDLALAVSCLGRDPTVIDATDADGNTPLHMAAYHGHTPVVAMLVERGATLTIANAAGSMPVHYASAQGQLEILDVLLQAEPSLVHERDEGHCTPLQLCVLRPLRDALPCVSILVEAGAQIDDNIAGTCLLHLVAHQVRQA